MNTETIFESIEAADEAMPNCPRAHAGSGGYHWWYIDSEEHEKQMESDDQPEFVPCVCKTCSQKMRLSVSADEYPAV